MISLKYLYAMIAGAFGGQPDLNLRGRRPTGSQLRNPADPVQAARIEAAAVKRGRRAEKLQRDAAAAVNNNWAHGIGKRHVHLSPVPDCSGRLNPFYIAK